jgi:hypothetical protein
MVDIIFDPSLILDNIKDVNYIQDDEHKYDRYFHKYYLVIDMDSVENNLLHEEHKYQSHQKMIIVNMHMHYSMNIDYIPK